MQYIFNSSREVVAEQDENKWMLYIRASSLLASSTDHARTYYHYASDEMGSTTHIVDGEGAVENRYAYDAWGNITEQTENVPNRFKFNGQQLDPISQQYYLRARFYNPVIARFTQEDTYRGDGLNLYAYCANNPVVYEDPTGNYRNCVKDAFDRIRRENPELSATDAYARALKEAGKDRVPKPNASPQGEPSIPPDVKAKWDRYFADIEQQTGRKIPEAQKQAILAEIANNPHSTKLTGSTKSDHRKDFNNDKQRLIDEWEEQTGQPWPQYKGDIISPKTGKPYILEGSNYDAHEIIPNVYNSPLEWWNLHPAHNGSEHQGGIHGSGHSIYDIFN